MNVLVFRSTCWKQIDRHLLTGVLYRTGDTNASGRFGSQTVDQVGCGWDRIAHSPNIADFGFPFLASERFENMTRESSMQ